MARALINVPQKAKRGEVIEIKTMIQPPRETGFRVGYHGQWIPRDIIQTFACRYNDVEIFHADLSSAIAANPFISFTTVATETGKIAFKWTGDNGFSVDESVDISVE